MLAFLQSNMVEETRTDEPCNYSKFMHIRACFCNSGPILSRIFISKETLKSPTCKRDYFFSGHICLPISYGTTLKGKNKFFPLRVVPKLQSRKNILK